MILITSAAGQTGTRMIKRLVERGVPVRGLVTKAASAAQIEALGAMAVMGDLRDDASLCEALQGVEKLYHIAPTLSFNEYAMGQRIIAAAKHAGIRHFVLHGVIAPYLDNINYHWAKQRVQLDLYRSGLPYTVLLPTNFMQNVNWTWPTIADRGIWELPYDVEKRLTWVDLDDVAEAAVNVLTQPGHEYGSYELVGQDAFLSRREIAARMTQVLGRTVTARKVGIDEYLDAYRKMPFFERKSAEELGQIRAMFLDYDRYGMPAGNSRVLGMLLGRAPCSYTDFLHKLHGATRAPQGAALTNYGLPQAA